MTKNLKIKFKVPIFFSFTEPHGRLNRDPECHALFYYYTVASGTWRRETTELVYEGELDPIGNYEQLFRNAALMYHADVEKMANYWPLVDAEIERQSMMKVLTGDGIPLMKMPEQLKFRNNPIKVKDREKMN